MNRTRKKILMSDINQTQGDKYYMYSLKDDL